MTDLPAQSPTPGGMRASDQDRDKVAEALREAAAEGRLTMEELGERLDQVFAAKTYGELTAITADLPAAGTHPPAVAASGPAAPAASTGPVAGQAGRFGGQPAGSTAVALLSGFCRRGAWVAPKKMTAIAVMGGGEIDLREARFEEPTVTIQAFTIMGGVSILVPEDADVQVNGFGLMGGFDDQGAGSGAPGGPTILVTGFAMMGGVSVQRKPARTSRSVAGRHPGELDVG